MVVGTLSVSYNSIYNKSHGVNTAHFFFYEVIDDINVTRALFAQAEAWAREHKAEHIMGPFMSGLGNGSGMLIEGFDYPGTMTMMRYNPPYYVTHVNTLGFTKYTDLNSYLAPSSKNFKADPRVERVISIVKKRGKFELKKFKTNRKMIQAAKEMFSNLMNDLLGTYPENYPLPQNEIAQMLKDMRFIMRKDMAVYITYEGKTVGYGLAFPDITEAMQRCAGKVNPVNIARLLWNRRYTKRHVCNGIGIMKEYQRMGGSALMYAELFNLIRTWNYDYVEYTQIGETTANTMSELSTLVERKHKTHRIMIKDISGIATTHNPM